MAGKPLGTPSMLARFRHSSYNPKSKARYRGKRTSPHPIPVRRNRLAALGSVGSAVVLVSLKIFLTLATGSLGVLSEALHSSLDLIAAIITYLSVRVSDRAGRRRPSLRPRQSGEFFGVRRDRPAAAHRRIHHLGGGAAAVFPRGADPAELAGDGILGIALGIDWCARARWRAWRGNIRARRWKPTRCIFPPTCGARWWSLLGIARCGWAQRTGLAWLRYADPLAALAVAAVVIWVGARLGRRTVDALLDAAPAGLQERVAARGGANSKACFPPNACACAAPAIGISWT